MNALRLILGDQLHADIRALYDYQPGDVILMAEVMEEATYAPHHPKKIAFLFAAMRHFAAACEARGLHVRYVRLDDPGNRGTLEGEVARALEDTGLGQVICTSPGEWRLLQQMEAWQTRLGVPVEIRDDARFLCPPSTFRQWAAGKKQLRMELFYRQMRQQYGILMEPDGQPTGGQWNYDKQNRKPPKTGMRSPRRLRHPRSAITADVLTLVEARFASHFGDLHPFYFAVTREEALLEAQHFMRELLPFFGDYQDAMVKGEAYLYHSLLAAYLNAGLLLPLELCRMAEAAYRTGKAPLNAAEGFIRQILGWREYVRGIYWHFMPAYEHMNSFGAERALPAFYWGAPTGMACIAEAVAHTRVHAYSHHIQRLMVTGNFALLAGLDPHEVHQWYLAVYADAYGWVEVPNTIGMALHADGGIMASKPYAASGKYIQRMSNFCTSCRYDPEQTVGPNACPFNALYWDFLARHADRLRNNQRMPYVYATWEKFGADKQQAIRAQAQHWLQQLDQGTL